MTPDFPRPIPESYWVRPGQFLAGEYPGSWDPERTRRRLDSFLEAGFNCFIDLTCEGELFPYAPVLAEQAAYYSLSAAHRRMPIGDFTTPTVIQMRAILDAIDNSLEDGHKLYLHCWGGVGRTGAAVGCYLVRHGKTGDDALAQLAEWWRGVPKRALHPRSPETDEQVQFIRDWKAGQ